MSQTVGLMAASPIWNAETYELFNRNCVTFAEALAAALGTPFDRTVRRFFLAGSQYLSSGHAKTSLSETVRKAGKAVPLPVHYHFGLSTTHKIAIRT